MTARCAPVACAALLACGGPPAGHPATDEPPAPAYDDDATADASSDRTLRFYYGPMKIMAGETALLSIAAFTGHDFGSWDVTAPEPTAQAFFDAGNADGSFYRHCRQLGGCLDHRIPLGRTGFVNTGFVLQLERAVIEACSDREAFGMFPGGVAPDGVGPVDVIQHQYVGIFGVEADAEELDRSVAYFEGHLADPERDDVSPLESAGRGHCRALLTTNRFLFY